ncbi:MAG: sugar kinase, partial [Propionibacteriaceae bacterium]|nr:sugar kinase [Propionibacteriaceae bacterium]
RRGRRRSSVTGGILVVGDVINDVLVRPLAEITPDSDTPSQIVRRPGGSAANLACWLGSLGADVTFVGRVGRDDHALHADYLAQFGVKPLLALDPEAETGTIVIVVDTAGRRTMLTDRAANLNLTADDIPTDVLAGARLLHISGYSLFEPGTRAAMLELMHRARTRGLPISVDPSSVACLRDVGAGQFLEWTQGVALAFPNRDEALFLAGTDDPNTAADRLAEHYGMAVVTLDGDGAVLGRPGSRPLHIATDRIAAVDSTGAGDSFCAGFLDAWLRGADEVTAVEAGAALARTAVSRMGARPVAPASGGKDIAPWGALASRTGPAGGPR